MPEHVIDIGNSVVCDWCNEDYTNSNAKGGILFSSYAICPKCEKEAIEGAKKHNEENMILARCKEGQTFAEFVMEIRGGDNTIAISSFD